MMKRPLKPTLLYCLCSLSLAGLLLFAARLSAGFAEWYARQVFPILPQTLGRLFSLLPFSLAEWLLLFLALGLAFLLLYALTLLRSATARAKLAALLPRCCSLLLVMLCTLPLLFMLSFGVNCSRAPLAHSLELEPRVFSAEDLRQLYHILLSEADGLPDQVGTDSEGHFCLPAASGARQPAQTAEQARLVMRGLAQDQPLFAAYYPRPKPVYFSLGMSYLHISGIYSPFTMEANYNRDIPHSNLPFTICHELAHLSGFAREDEANFVAYLACQGSADLNFQYSGLFNALLYVLSALYENLPGSEYRELYAKLPAQIQRDLQQNSAYWQRFAGRAAELSQEANDRFLKANDQPAGVASYDLLVELLLAYYLD